MVHISNPLTLGHLARLGDPETRDRIRMAIPLRLHRVDGAEFVVPWAALPLAPNPLSKPGSLGSTGRLRALLRHRGFRRPDLMLVDQPLLDYLIDPIDPGTVIYRPTDVMSGQAARRAEQRVLRRTAGVIATSAVVADRLTARYPGLPHAVVENGVDLRHFGGPAPLWARRSGAVYVGALDRRFDWATVAAMGRDRPDERIDLYGPARRVPVTLPPNVVLRGPVAHHLLPATLSEYRVGLLPLNDDSTNPGRSPMKLFEYLAAGLSVVARRTPAIDRHALADVHPYGAAEPDPAGVRHPDAPIDGAVAALRVALSSAPSAVTQRAVVEMSWERRARMVLDAAEWMRDAERHRPSPRVLHRADG